MTQDKGSYHGEEFRVILPYHQGWVCIVLGRGRAVKRTTQLKCPVGMDATCLGETAQLLYRRGDEVMPQILPSNNNNVQKDDDGQTAFIIMEVYNIRRKASGRNMRDFIPWPERYRPRGVKEQTRSLNVIAEERGSRNTYNSKHKE